MNEAHDKSIVAKMPSKKATNISLSMDVYRDAKELGINISQLCEQKLREEIQTLTERQRNARLDTPQLGAIPVKEL